MLVHRRWWVSVEADTRADPDFSSLIKYIDRLEPLTGKNTESSRDRPPIGIDRIYEGKRENLGVSRGMRMEGLVE